MTRLGNNGVFVLVSIMIAALFVDKSIVPVSVYTGGVRSSAFDIAIYTVISLTYAIGQWIILQYVDLKFQTSIRWMRSLYAIVFLVQYVLILIHVSIIFGMIFTSSYSAFLMKTCIWINYVMLIIILGILAHRFFLWYRSQRNIVVLSYGITMAILSLNGAVTILFMQQEFSGQQRGVDYIKPHPHVFGITVVIDKTIPSVYAVMSTLSFISFWFSTVVLLRHYSKKIGMMKYWIIVSIPLVYFLSQYQSLIIGLFYPLRVQNPALFGVLYVLMFTGAKPLGGFLFAIAFWSIARNINSKAIKDYTIMSAYGTMLLFTSNQPSGLGLIPYPPFGLPTISFLGLSSYLILLGIYSSALSVSNDSEIRRSIVRSVAKESSLILHDIGIAQVQNQLQKRVIKLTEKFADRITNETGIESSLQEEDIKDYVSQVIKEVHSEKD